MMECPSTKKQKMHLFSFIISCWNFSISIIAVYHSTQNKLSKFYFEQNEKWTNFLALRCTKEFLQTDYIQDLQIFLCYSHVNAFHHFTHRLSNYHHFLILLTIINHIDINRNVMATLYFKNDKNASGHSDIV